MRMIKDLLPIRTNTATGWEKDSETSLTPVAPRAKAQALPARSVEKQLLAVLALFLLSLGVYYLVSRYIITSVQVQGRSMAPTLTDGERYLLNRWTFHYRAPHRGDVVVLRDPGHNDFAVKRIVAGPLDSVAFKNGKVLVNGQELDEPYLARGMKTQIPETCEKMILIGKDQYFVLGDNRAVSEDSRYYGAIRSEAIVGALWR